jgi:hypothetical protein
MERERESSEDGSGGLKLPIGFRFRPTDEELLVHYLKRKVWSMSLPAAVVPEFEVFHSNPWDLPGDSKEKRYFFCKTKSNFMSKCSGSLSTDCGFWKPTGKDKLIMGPGRNQVIGIKKPFVFYQVNKSLALKTQWTMHEYCLVCSVATPYLPQKLMVQVGDWVVCRVYQRKRKARNHGTSNDHQLTDSRKSRTLRGVQAGDHMNLRMGDCNNRMGFSVAQCSSSCSSGITEISSRELDQEESSRYDVS